MYDMLTPGMAQAPVSFLLIATNSRTGFPSRSTLAPLVSLFHLKYNYYSSYVTLSLSLHNIVIIAIVDQIALCVCVVLC